MTSPKRTRAKLRQGANPHRQSLPTLAGFARGDSRRLANSDNHQSRPQGTPSPPKSFGSFSIMLIGVPKEIKNHEYRVGMTPLSVREAVRHGHKVWVQAGAGLGIGASDEEYKTAGAQIIPTAEEIFAKADMIVKVKEPQAVERKMLREGQILYTYLHLAPDPEQTKDLIK